MTRCKRKLIPMLTMKRWEVSTDSVDWNNIKSLIASETCKTCSSMKTLKPAIRFLRERPESVNTRGCHFKQPEDMTLRFRSVVSAEPKYVLDEQTGRQWYSYVLRRQFGAMTDRMDG